MNKHQKLRLLERPLIRGQGHFWRCRRVLCRFRLYKRRRKRILCLFNHKTQTCQL